MLFARVQWGPQMNSLANSRESCYLCFECCTNSHWGGRKNRVGQCQVPADLLFSRNGYLNRMPTIGLHVNKGSTKSNWLGKMSEMVPMRGTKICKLNWDWHSDPIELKRKPEWGIRSLLVGATSRLEAAEILRIVKTSPSDMLYIYSKRAVETSDVSVCSFDTNTLCQGLNILLVDLHSL